MAFLNELKTYLCAGYATLGIDTTEEGRVLQEIKQVALDLGMDLITWNIADGFSKPQGMTGNKYISPMAALEAIGSEETLFPPNCIFVLQDFHVLLTDVRVARKIRSLVNDNQLVNGAMKHPLIMTGPQLKIPTGLHSCVTIVEFKLPDEVHLTKVLEFVLNSIRKSDPAKADCPPELQEQIIQKLLGLTTTEAENLLSRCAVKHQGLIDPIVLTTIRDEKAVIIGKSAVLTYIPESQQAAEGDIGGFDVFMPWLARRALAYTKEARQQRMDYPKGVVLIGVPGSGKSVVAQVAARVLGLEPIVLDVGSIFGSLVGQSEATLRDALRQVEAQKGCVLLLDEFNQALGGAQTAGGDSGVTRRVFGQLLSWLSTKNDRTFVIVTMNRTDGLPPEFFRAGRFDAVFFTDLPHEAEREVILRIHLRKRGIDPETLGMTEGEWAAIVQKTEGFVGSELEEIVREARYMSFAVSGSGIPTFDSLMTAAADVTPVSVLDKEGVEAIRRFCIGRARPVSSTPRKVRRTRSRHVDVGGTDSTEVNINN